MQSCSLKGDLIVMSNPDSPLEAIANVSGQTLI